MKYGRSIFMEQENVLPKYARDYGIDRTKYMTLTEIAEKYNVNMVTVKNRLKEGAYPHAVMIKHSWFIPIEEVGEIVKKNRGKIVAPEVEGYMSRQELIERSGCDVTYLSHQINRGMFGDRLKIGVHVYVDRERAEKYIAFRNSMLEIREYRKGNK